MCPGPNPAVLSVSKESRERGLLHYHVLHDGEQLRFTLENASQLSGFPDAWHQSGVTRFTRPRTGPVKVYYNPEVDIVLITEGLQGLSIPPWIRPPWKDESYSRLLGYDLSRIRKLGMLWCRTGAACDITAGYPGDYLNPWVRDHGRREQYLAAYSDEFLLWKVDFTWFLFSEHRPLPTSIVLLDVLNPDPRMARNLGAGIALFRPASADMSRRIASDTPPSMMGALGELEEPFEEAKAEHVADGSDWASERTLGCEARFCLVRSSSASGAEEV